MQCMKEKGPSGVLRCLLDRDHEGRCEFEDTRLRAVLRGSGYRVVLVDE